MAENTTPVNYQDAILNEARKTKTGCVIFLTNGFQIRGQITGFDNFVVCVFADGKSNMIYKHAISTVAPCKRLNAFPTV